MRGNPIPKPLQDKVEAALLRLWLRHDDEFTVRRTGNGFLIKKGKVEHYVHDKT